MRKSGFTLVELIAVMATLFAVMGVSVVLLVKAFDFQQTNTEYADGVRVADRLIAEFRNDVHVYGKPEIPNDGKTLIRWMSDTVTLEYAMEPGIFPDQQSVVRSLQKDGQTFRETYHLPEKTTVWCVMGKDGNDGLVALSLWTTPQGTELPPLDTLNPFDRTMPESKIDPKYAGNWRTIIARYNKE
jgi:type II secretory pathway pseudopilin PulG